MKNKKILETLIKFLHKIPLEEENIKINLDNANEKTRLVEELGFDSLDKVDYAMSIEEEFDIAIPDKEIPRFKTLGDYVKYISNYKLE